MLTPGRYVGAAEQKDDGVAFETKMRELSQTLFEQMKQAEELIERFVRTSRCWVMGNKWTECELGVLLSLNVVTIFLKALETKAASQ